MSSARVVVVGIGADGWAGLGEQARAAVFSCEEVIGSTRQLSLLPDGAPPGRILLPLQPFVDALVQSRKGRICVLASGDPMLHGIGATLARQLPAQDLEIIPHVSAFAIACARLQWPAAEVTLISTVARPPETVSRSLQPGRKLIVYATGTGGAAAVAQVLCDRGYGPSEFTVMEELDGPQERLVTSTAQDWGGQTVAPLHAIAITCLPVPETQPLATTPGIPDDAYENDGQLTKRHVRAATLAVLAPKPGELLWDVGGGSGSIAIEWLRAEPTAEAITIEADSERAERIGRNALTLGVPALQVVTGRAPDALSALAQPDAIFIGGGVTSPGIIDICWEALSPGGRLVANAVTLEGEQILITGHTERGGDLTQIAISHAAAIGGFTAWRAAIPVTQWSVTKR